MMTLVYSAAPKIMAAGVSQQVDAIVDREKPPSVGTYATLADALAAAPAASPRPWTIAIGAGDYREKLTITKPNIHLVGLGTDKTRLIFNAYAGQKKPDSDEHWGTLGSATLTVKAEGFAARHLTIANDFDFLDNDGRDPESANRVGASQAVALFLSHGADKSLFYDVALTGYQDTLFADAGRSLFSHCSISGNVDFIFGGGTALFESCDIISRPRANAHILPAGFVVAPCTAKDQRFGLIFNQCHLKKERDDQPPGSHYLGRPWHPTRDFPDGRYADPHAIGQAAFLHCTLDDHIATDGWTSMSGLAPDGQRKWFQPLEDARFFEYQSLGPGAQINGHRPQLSDADAADYTLEHILGDWHPAHD